ncbi:DNA cytosine methyltransferase [Timonella sp. A28]|uniref:DNA cytosine methyltransferase n=1 Tax=Timonella sp. A28 TaxID=3442640 RepID=UPI003EC10036
MVAISQTSVIGSERRRIGVKEAADLQGFPSDFDFGPQKDSQSFKQMGNAVNVGVAYQVLRTFIRSISKNLIESEETEKITKIASVSVKFNSRLNSPVEIL